MRSLDIELAEEGVEARLLLQAIEAWRAGRLLAARYLIERGIDDLIRTGTIGPRYSPPRKRK
jgi:hypothetical protein